MSQGLWIAIAVIAVLVIIALVVGSVLYRRRQVSLRGGVDTAIEAPTPVDRSGGYTASSGITFTQSSGPAPVLDTTGLPGVGDDAAIPRDSLKRPISQVQLPEPELIEEPADIDIPVDIPVSDEVVPTVAAAPAAPDIDSIAPPAGRLERLR